MNWIPLESETQVEEIIENSKKRPQVIFKHSTRCSISAMIKSRLERSEAPENVDFYMLNVIKFRSVSNLVAEKFQIRHESPQVILLKDGNPVYNEDHSAIYMDDIVGDNIERPADTDQ